MKTMLAGGAVTLYGGDCLEVLRTLPENSIDSIVTDPPYGLEFMGKYWDHGVPGVPYWQAAMRVLKPGGHMLAFGGTRTYHRLVCAIEDAGFEIRDTIAWVYGCLDAETKAITPHGVRPYDQLAQGDLILSYDVTQGSYQWEPIEHVFTYRVSDTVCRVSTDYGDQVVSRNHRCIVEQGGAESFSLASELARQCEARVPVLEDLPELLATLRDSCKGASDAQLGVLEADAVCDQSRSQAVRSWKGHKTVVGRVTQEHYDGVLWCVKVRTGAFVAVRNGFAFPTGNSGFPKSLDVSKAIDGHFFTEWLDANPKQAEQYRAQLAQAKGDAKATEHIKNEFHEMAGVEREVIGPGRYGARGSQSDFGCINDDGWTPKPRLKTAAGTPEAAQWDGWGTALKPAFEPIVVARKPLAESTVAGNVLQFGTGALNIDACRVEGAKPDTTRGAGGQHGRYSPLNGQGLIMDDGRGRWPANLAHDGSEEVVGAFPGAGAARTARREAAATGMFSLPGDGHRFGDSGSAARFFYCAKANKKERIARLIEKVTVEWTSESGPCRAVLQVDTERSPKKDIAASVLEGDNGWSMFLYGRTLTDLFRKASKYITSTRISSTTKSITWSWLMTLLTNESMADVRSETGSGGNLAESAAHGVGQLTITLAETASLPGANHAVSGTQLRISVSVESHGHPTIKPIKLMQWLVRLVTPPGGLVLDPFAGTGTTGQAAIGEGFRAVLIEKESEYQNDIRRRFGRDLEGERLLGLD